MTSFVGPADSNKCSCDLSTFICNCRDIGVQLKKEKTVLPTTSLIIYGMEIYSVNMVS